MYQHSEGAHTHFCHLTCFAKPQPRAILTSPGSCDTERMVHVAKCAGTSPVGSITCAKQSVPASSCCATATRITPAALSHPFFSLLHLHLFFSLLYFFPLLPLSPLFCVMIEGLWSMDHPFTLCVPPSLQSSPGTVLHNRNAQPGGWRPKIPGKLKGEQP